MAKLVRIDALEELGLDEPNFLHIQESYLRQVAHGKPFTAKKKRKSEVAGTGAKLLRQKGTGRARQGERRNPHMTGGGLAFAPHPRVAVKRLNKRVRVSALRSAVLWHIQSGSAHYIEGADFDGFAKTRQVAEVLHSVPGSGDICLVLLRDVLAWRGSRNIAGVRRLTPAGLNVRDLVEVGNLVFSFGALESYRKLLQQQWMPGAAEDLSDTALELDSIDEEQAEEGEEVMEEVAQ